MRIRNILTNCLQAKTQERKSWAKQNSTLSIHCWLVFFYYRLYRFRPQTRETWHCCSFLHAVFFPPTPQRLNKLFSLFTAPGIRTPGATERHVSAGCRPHALVGRICSIIWSAAFVTAGRFCFICHSLWWNSVKKKQNIVSELYLFQAAGKCVQQRGAQTDCGVRLEERSLIQTIPFF